MKESGFDDSGLEATENNKSTYSESNIINKHEKKMSDMLENSHNIVKQIKKMSDEISEDLKFQNKLISDISETVNKTDFQMKKNTSKIEEVLLKTSTCSLIVSAIIQVMVIVFLILL